MKRLLLPLLAALALPTAVNAAEYYLIIHTFAERLAVVPMNSEEACERAGKKMQESKRFSKAKLRSKILYECLSFK